MHICVALTYFQLFNIKLEGICVVQCQPISKRNERGIPRGGNHWARIIRGQNSHSYFNYTSGFLIVSTQRTGSGKRLTSSCEWFQNTVLHSLQSICILMNCSGDSIYLNNFLLGMSLILYDIMFNILLLRHATAY